MEDQKKASFSFNYLRVVSILILFIDVFMSYILNNNSSYQIIESKEVYLKVLKFVLRLKQNQIFSTHINIKGLSLIILIIAIALGNNRKKFTKKNNEEKTTLEKNIVFAVFFSILFLFNQYVIPETSILYFISTIIIYFTLTFYLTYVFSFFKNKMGKDRFTKNARIFEQEKRLITNKYSVNIKTEDGYINIINPFRATAVMGTPGSGKSFAVLLPAIEQSIQNGFSMYIYDYKFSDLTTFAYNAYLKYYDNYKIKPVFNIINFDDPEYTHRCNPLQPDLLLDFVDAMESAKTIMMGLNKSWIEKGGDFFVESPINFLGICIWALKLKSDEVEKEYQLKKENLLKKTISKEEYERELKIIEDARIIYCTLPHVIQLVSTDYKKLFHFLQQYDDPSIKNVLAPFGSALENESYEQLDGQIASVRLGLSRLTSPIIYYVMTTGKQAGENISLQINDPDNPQILCIGNNPERQEIYSACISLYNSRILKMINKKGQTPTSVVYDELPTLSMPKGTIDNLIATARSNKIATWLGFQDLQQLKRDYGDKNAAAIFGTIGNIVTGMITGDTAKQISSKFGKIKIMKENYSVNKGIITTSYSEEMQETITQSDLETLGQGWFAGNVADTFAQEIEQKLFYSKIIIDLEERKELEKHSLPKIFDFKKAGLDVDEALNYNMMKIINQMDELLEIVEVINE